MNARREPGGVWRYSITVGAPMDFPHFSKNKDVHFPPNPPHSPTPHGPTKQGMIQTSLQLSLTQPFKPSTVELSLTYAVQHLATNTGTFSFLDGLSARFCLLLDCSDHHKDHGSAR